MKYKQRLFLSLITLFTLSAGLIIIISLNVQKQWITGQTVFMHDNRIYILLVSFPLLVILACFLYLYRKYYQSIKNLKYFISYFNHHNRFPSNISFKDPDLRQIQYLMQDIYTQIQQREKQIIEEREKLIEHFHYAEERIAFFTSEWQNIYTNSHMEKDNFNRSEMANNIAHELATPITSIRGYFETLLTHPTLSADKQQDYIRRAYNQTIRLSEIIQDTVLLSRAHTAPHSFLLEEINLHEILQYITQEVDQEMITIYNATIQIQVDQTATIKGNRTLICSIFLNLVHNAIKYAGQNGTIIINQYKEDQDFYYFSFTDTGPGIEEKLLDRIFERFYQIGQGRTRTMGGSGLGLSIVKEAVVFHHGQISARNRVGGGLEFLFTLRKY